MTLTLVSLFDGIGGFPLAFERAGVRTVATIEIDSGAAGGGGKSGQGYPCIVDTEHRQADD